MQIFVEKTTSRVVFVSTLPTSALQPLEDLFLTVHQIDTDLSVLGCTNFCLKSKKLVDSGQADPSTILLSVRCNLLAKTHDLCEKVRRPYEKTLPLQEYIYDRKFTDAMGFISCDFAENRLPEFVYLTDEAEILKVTPKRAALEIARKRIEREEVLRASEKARRYFITRICTAKTYEELSSIQSMMYESHFKKTMTFNE